ncbi:nucleoporin Nup186/Nup192/Nup205 [Cristinia sonorae]|uniref:Nucleoporin Nup186/Nup192/Nup205 n=1 Tax=Cristinia sonorae TaxID=1940300 RepID=A0A8K0UPQ2_9AGAR|nr:nucleoporin Nup186/Nup192/Nup205 [Cristinia sonorae]
MQSTSALRAILLSTLGAPNHAQATEQDLYEELMAHKHIFLNLYDVGKRSPEQQRAVESGKTTIRGKPMALNADFSRQVIFISQQLDCSEQYAAELLHDVMSSHPNLVEDRCLEATVLEHHTRRRQVAECLKYVFEAAVASQYPDAPPLLHRLELFVREQLLSRQGSTTTLTEKLLNEVDRIGEALNVVNTDRQNAGSLTVASVQGGQGPRLGHDLLTARRESLEYERSLLSTLLFMASRMGYLSGAEICRVVDWLRSHPNHCMVLYYLPIVLVAFDIVDPSSTAAHARRRLISDANFVKQLHSKLHVDNQWSEPGLKATILLKWTIFLTDIRHRDSSLEEKEGFKAEQLESNIWNAVQGDCFSYLTSIVLRLQCGRNIPVPASFSQVAPVDRDITGDVPLEDFVPSILEALEVVVRSLISYASSELRKIKQRQEDLLVAGLRSDRSKTWRSTSQPAARHPSGGDSAVDQAQSLRNDVAALFSFIGLLYSSLPPDHALSYWGAANPAVSYNDHLEASARKLPSFLQWAVWSTQPQNLTMMTALYDMLTGLANGERCSELAYNFLARGIDSVSVGRSPTVQQGNVAPTVSWASMFNVLESWAAAASTPRSNPSSNPFPGGHPGSLAPDAWQNQGAQHHTHPAARLSLTLQDVLVAQAFLHLLSTVAIHSVPVRVTICGHARFRAVQNLVSLIPLGIPLELKGTIFDTLAAFCKPGAGTAGLNICKSVWTMMERLEIINVRGSTTGSTATSVKGVEVELEQVESAHKVYPATIAFVKLLGTLIHTPKSVSLQGALAPESIVTIPEGLGHSYRTPGITPYIHFVIDNVFTSISRREYLHPSDRWRMNDACLAFIERCLASFELESLAANNDTPAPNNISTLTHHPGYEIMARLLTQSALQGSVLSYITEGTDGFDKGLSEEQPFFRRTITRVLRIVHRVLEIQDIFLDVLVPLLNEAKDSGLHDVRPASYYVKLSQALFFTPNTISAIAMYVTYPAHLEARLLAVKILSCLAGPSTVRQLAVIIDQSPNSSKIVNGFLSIINAESWIDVEAAEIEADRSTGAGAVDDDVSPDAVTQAVRLAVLDFLADNTSLDLPYPNIAHLILFGQVDTREQISDPGAVDGQRACIHALLDLVNKGIPHSSGRNRTAIPEEPLYTILPGLAERCYAVIHRLCKHPSTTVFVSRYLRTREDFFARHLRAIPCKVPAVVHRPSAEVVYQDGSRVATTVSALCSFLRLRSYILDLVALELHLLTAHGQHKAVADLLSVLFETEGDALLAEASYIQNDMFKPFKEVGQAQSKIIELLQRLDFDWSDGFAVEPLELQFFSGLNLLSCLHTDRVGCEVVDRSALLSLLSNARLELHAQGHLVTPAHVDQMSQELTYILQSCAVENHRRQVQHGMATSIQAWGDVLNTALIRCFSRIPLSQQENILLDLLHALPIALQSDAASPATAAIIAEALVTALTKLREVLLQAQGAQQARKVSLPPERLHSFLRNLLNCIVNPSRSQMVRGNLYACLIHYLHLVILLDGAERSSTTESELALVSSREQASNWIKGSIELIRPLSERLSNVIARDGSDGAEVWRTVALLALDALVQVCDGRCNFVTALSRPGHLVGFVKSVEESDGHLQAVLKSTADDLNALYAYEACMSLFSRVVQSKIGAEQLLNGGLVRVLSKCDFIDARPEVEDDQAVEDDRDYLPSVSQRYHQLTMPALQIGAGISLTLGSKHGSAVHQVLEFMNSHRDAFILLLRSNGAGQLTTGTMEDINFLVSICTAVVQGVPQAELHSSSGYGSLHTAILSFTAQFMSCVIAANDSHSLRDVPRIWHQLLQSLLLYLETTDDIPGFKSVFSPSLNSSQSETSVAYLNSQGPTLGDAIGMMNVLTHHLLERLQNSLPSYQSALTLYSSAHAKETSPRSDDLQLADSVETILLLLWRQKSRHKDSQNVGETLNLKIRSTMNELLAVIDKAEDPHPWRHLGDYIQHILSLA